MSHVELVRTCEENIQIKQIGYLQPGKISSLHVEEIGAKTVSSISEYNCGKETFKDRELTQIESEAQAQTTEEKETNKTSTVDVIDLLDLGRNSRSTSPIFNIKITNRKPYTPPDLVFDLESFERFENIAFSLISTTKDLEVVKQLVNSQILNKELYLYGNKNICLSDAPSPLFVTEKYVKINNKERDLKANTDDNGLFDDISKINQSLTYKSHKENYTSILKGKISIENINDAPKSETNAFHYKKQSKNIEDEILFSSDEESEYVHEEYKDLPLTCAIGTSFDNKSEVLDKTMYVGFETASKKIIQISTDSYIKAKSIMSIDVEGKSLNDLVSLIDSFKTASNKKVAISKEALERCKNIFNNINISTEFDELGHPFSSQFRNKEKTCIKNKCEDLDLNIDHKNNSSKASNISEPDKVENTSFQGFQTTNNKYVHMLEEVLQRKNIDIPKTFKEIENNAKNNKAQISSFKGFQTANNKPVKISTEALLRSKNIFQDINVSEIFCGNSNASNTDIENINFQDFKTASNKKVAVSKDALERCKNILDNINITTEFDELGHPISSQFCNKEKTCRKNEFEDLDLNIDHKNNASKASNISEIDKLENSSFQGFQTTNNKSVHVLEEVLQRKNIDISKKFKEIENNAKNNKAQIPPFKGFQTANNIPVKVSTEALLRSKNIFQDINFSENFSGNSNASNTDIENINFQGFKTASNKKVAISKEALERCKNIFDNINITTELDELSHPISSQFRNKKETCIKNVYEDRDLNIDHKINASEASIMADKTYHRSLSDLLFRNKNLNTLSSDDNADNVESKTQKYHRKDSTHNSNNEKQNELHKIRQNEGSVSIDKECNKVSIKQVDADLNIEHNANKILNTQLLNNFESTLYTEDFHITPPKINRRSGSPILSCPKAKKRKKFEVPYRTDPFMKNNVQSPANLNIENQKKYEFDNNYKKHKRYLLRDLMNIEAELKLNNSNYDDVKTLNHLEDIDLKTFIFRQDRNDLYSNRISVRELKTIFENSVDKKIIPEKWFENHMKMILWKFFEYENKFPNSMKYVCRVTNVLEQLKYRYNIELHNAKRPALRRILEKDDIPSKLMVLRVAGIYVDDAVTYSVTNPTPNIELLLTDGWYAIKSSVDKMMASLICSKKIGIGTKLATWGAELLNCEQGISPWENHLTSTQQKLLEEHTNKRREKLLEDIQKRVREKIESKGLCVNRNVIPLSKIRVVGVENKNGVEVTKGVLSIWKPNDAILDLIEEGIWIDVTNVVPTAIRLSEIHLSAGRQSVFKKYTPKSDSCKLYLDIYNRQALTVSELVARPSTEYNEIDTVGVVIDIEPNMEEFDAKKHAFQNVYLTDENKNVVSVNFWGGLKKSGYENMFEIGQIVCGINLHKRLGNSRKTIPSYRVTEFSYFTKTPKYKNLKLILDNLYEKMTGVDIKNLRAECLSLKNKFTSKVYNNENMSPFRSSCNNITVNRNIIAQNSPIFNHKSDDFDLSGLDFDSTFKHSEQQDISPKLLQRKRQINEKIAKLKMYGDPPPLNQIYIINQSKNASNNYKTPFFSENNVCDRSNVDKFYNKNNSTTTEILRDQSNVSEIVDPFSEEFDESPPLSLD
ncbi:hypothetical protein K1T71_000973 [Dendrolimus kikuchii]|uniref:Uncharacterized protein n=1 Tax=Dendrolimus kikuchii TaxID=765133 RepID=A0ACC1DHA9_9NEOP|nr:hypothetical protein K1T71_000973 [Dendrolimus kikuchii]